MRPRSFRNRYSVVKPQGVTVFAINHEPRGKKKPRKGKASKIKPKSSRKLAKTGDASARNCTICTKASSEGHAVKREGMVENDEFDLD